MGKPDIVMEIKESPWWIERNQRMRRLKTRAASASVEENGTMNTMMGHELHKAATKENVDKFIDALELLHRGLTLSAIFNQVSPLGNTVLHLASKTGHEETVRLLAYHYPSLFLKRNSRGDTALHVAAKAGQKRVAETLYLFQSDAIVDDQSSLENEAESSLIDIRRKDLLVSLENDEGNTALHEAIIYRQKEVYSFLVDLDAEVWFHLNKEKKSPLYLAVEAGYKAGIEHMLEQRVTEENFGKWRKGKSPIHAAIVVKNTDAILKKEPRFISLRDERGRLPLHFAACLGHLDEVCYLLELNPTIALERDNNGFFPIHMASMKGHVDVVCELLPHYPDLVEILDHNGHNILHIAAKSGKYNVVSYMLKTSELQVLINEKDNDGNTPLHLATMHWHPKTVTSLSWCERIDLKVVNNEGLTALDIAEHYMERMPSFRKGLTWTALKVVGAPRAQNGDCLKTVNRQTSLRDEETPNMGKYKDRVNTLLLVSTIVASVTFAAGFTMPGGYNNSETKVGMATMLRNAKFQLFVFCDTIAMYSSIIVAVMLLWAQLGDPYLELTALKFSLPILGIALTMMSLAFMAGVYVMVGGVGWLASVVYIMGFLFLGLLAFLFFPLCFPISFSRFSRYMSFCPIFLLLVVAGCIDAENFDN